MTQAITLRPMLKELRDWLAAQNLAGVVGTRVYAGGLPTGATRPCVAITRVGGFASGPIDQPLVQIDSYAGANGGQAETVDAAVRSLLQSTPASTALTATLHFMGATEEVAGLLLRDPDTDEPRYSTTVEIVTKAV